MNRVLHQTDKRHDEKRQMLGCVNLNHFVIVEPRVEATQIGGVNGKNSVAGEVTGLVGM